MQPKVIANKPQYSEAEAARELGVSIEELRTLIRRHIVHDDSDADNVPMTSFQSADLLVLRLLARKSLPGVS